jgi:hypothetical protein
MMIAGIASALAVIALIAIAHRSRRGESPSIVHKPLLTRPEQVLYGRLVRAFPGHVVLAQVALLQLSGLNRDAHLLGAGAARKGFRRLVADFVVCTPDFCAAAVIEIDDRSPARRVPRERDQLKDQFLNAAGIKVVHLQAADLPNEVALRTLVAVAPIAAPSPLLARRAS